MTMVIIYRLRENCEEIKTLYTGITYPIFPETEIFDIVDKFRSFRQNSRYRSYISTDQLAGHKATVSKL